MSNLVQLYICRVCGINHAPLEPHSWELPDADARDPMDVWGEFEYPASVLRRDPPGTADPDARRVPRLPSHG